MATYRLNVEVEVEASSLTEAVEAAEYAFEAVASRLENYDLVVVEVTEA